MKINFIRMLYGLSHLREMFRTKMRLISCFLKKLYNFHLLTVQKREKQKKSATKDLQKVENALSIGRTLKIHKNEIKSNRMEQFS